MGATMGASVVALPAIWLMVATVVLLYGFAPRLTYLSWALLVAFLLIAEFGALFEWPSWVTDTSPFAHIPKLPAAPMAWGPILVLLVLAAALIAAGLLRRVGDGVRLLAKGEIKTKLTIEVVGASKAAIEAVEKLGGKVILPPVKEEAAAA